MTDVQIKVALEIATFGIAHGIATHAFKAVQKLSRSQLAEVLHRQSRRFSRRLPDMMSQKLRKKIHQIIPADDFRDLLREKGQFIIKQDEFERLWIHHALSKLSRTEINALLFQSREYGISKSLFFTDVGMSLASEFYEIVTADYYSEINPWEFLLHGLN